MNQPMDQLLELPNFMFAVLGVCFLVGMVLKAITSVLNTASRERSRREIAAYIAEGSITPEQGERLIRADVDRGASRHT